MCGRYSLTRPIKTIAEHFGAREIPWEAPPRYNVAPSQILPVVIQGPEGRRLDRMRWGLVPSWARSPEIGNRMINARSETVTEKPAFRNSFKSRRCLVPADGFYEWRREAEGKTPYYIRLKTGDLFAFAGLWAEWNANGTPLRTYTILTAPANRRLQPLHERMPVILLPGQYDLWMQAGAPPDSLKSLLAPLEQDLLEFYPVSRHVNSPKNDDPECLQPAG